MARPKPQTPIRHVAYGLEETEAVLKRLQTAYPDLRRVPAAKRDAIKAARAKLEEAAVALRTIIEVDSKSTDLNPPGK